jgi:holo-[acyl-carrier protein] synthase
MPCEGRAGDGGSLQVGYDLQEVSAVADSIAKLGERYLDRLLTTNERVAVEATVSGRERAELTAGIFAAKEAVFKLLKVLPSDAVPWRDIEVQAPSLSAVPTVRLTGAAAELAEAARLETISLSFSHAAGIVFALVAANAPGQQR